MSETVRTPRSIGVFCGARPGSGPRHAELAYDFGAALGARGLGLVYGAGGVGVMGAVADGAIDAGAPVTGVIPHDLHERERPDKARGEIFVVRGMHDRKALMYRLSEAFAVLPGGYGTLDELMEVATWNQLGFHDKPIVLVNTHGFFDPLIALLDHLVAEGFMSAHDRELVQAGTDVGECLDLITLNEPAALAG
ncbi:TIGR00730 family Rossman fold protein [Streptomyces sp. NPDC007983]|uniref:LOG family protein n=1 Tax=Streptomyces sp. NPDC007983 TaxID=3364800 RepID=UPI0036EA94DE